MPLTQYTESPRDLRLHEADNVAVIACRALHDAIRADELGRLVLGTATVPYFRPQSYYDSAAWRGTWSLDGGGALMNQGIHLVDLLLWLMGGEVEVVGASGGALEHEIEVEDCVTAALRPSLRSPRGRGPVPPASAAGIAGLERLGRHYIPDA